MDPKAAQLLSEKVAREVFRIAQAYGKQHPFSFDDLKHDVGVMLEHDSLSNLSLKFYRSNERREVLVEYNYAMHAGSPRFHLDDAQGIGIVPLRPPFEMGLVVHRDGRYASYASRLHLNWGDAPTYAHNGGFEHQDGNTAHRTGGRASKQIYMDHSLRRHGRIKFYRPDKQYGFIVGQDGVDIFFHAAVLQQDFEPYHGQRVSYLPLATPRGVQAKDVRPG